MNIALISVSASRWCVKTARCGSEARSWARATDSMSYTTDSIEPTEQVSEPFSNDSRYIS